MSHQQHNTTKRPFWFRPSFWRVSAPTLLIVATLALGIAGRWIEYADAGNKTKLCTKCWEVVGFLIGDEQDKDHGMIRNIPHLLDARHKENA